MNIDILLAAAHHIEQSGNSSESCSGESVLSDGAACPALATSDCDAAATLPAHHAVPGEHGEHFRRARAHAGLREVHNKLEKNRRAHLKQCFEFLRRQVPSLEDRRTSNLAILRGALRYISSLKRKEREFERERRLLTRQSVACRHRIGLLSRGASRPRCMSSSSSSTSSSDFTAVVGVGVGVGGDSGVLRRRLQSGRRRSQSVSLLPTCVSAMRAVGRPVGSRAACRSPLFDIIATTTTTTTTTRSSRAGVNGGDATSSMTSSVSVHCGGRSAARQDKHACVTSSVTHTTARHIVDHTYSPLVYNDCSATGASVSSESHDCESSCGPASVSSTLSGVYSVGGSSAAPVLSHVRAQLAVAAAPTRPLSVPAAALLAVPNHSASGSGDSCCSTGVVSLSSPAAEADAAAAAVDGGAMDNTVAAQHPLTPAPAIGANTPRTYLHRQRARTQSPMVAVGNGNANAAVTAARASVSRASPAQLPHVTRVHVGVNSSVSSAPVCLHAPRLSVVSTAAAAGASGGGTVKVRGATVSRVLLVTPPQPPSQPQPQPPSSSDYR